MDDAAAGLPDDAERLRTWYRRYNALCNAHRFAELGSFVADDVVVNGEPQGLDGYVAGLQAVVAAFPDYRWDLRHLVVEQPWMPPTSSTPERTAERSGGPPRPVAR